VKDLILALAKRGKTVILSSHLLSDVEDVCDRVVIYYGGKIQANGTLKDLLAKPDSLRITTPVLSRQTLERVLEIIRADAASGEVRVDNPTQNLESYFLDVVAKARAANETSGAQSGARVAEYLRGGMEAGASGERVLEKLALPQAAQTASAKAVTEAAPSMMDDSKLAALAQPTAPARPAEKSGPPTAAPAPVDLSKADEKLSSLLGGKK
jgi:ABC-2 type transport system ATP-binding protein